MVTRPLLVVLGTTPRAIFADIFLLIGWPSIERDFITQRTLAVFRYGAVDPRDDPLLFDDFDARKDRFELLQTEQPQSLLRRARLGPQCGPKSD